MLRKRPYLRQEWAEQVLKGPVHTEVQSDGRIRMWGYVADFRRGNFALRIVVLPDGETVHNMFPDRDFAARAE